MYLNDSLVFKNPFTSFTCSSSSSEVLLKLKIEVDKIVERFQIKSNFEKCDLLTSSRTSAKFIKSNRVQFNRCEYPNRLNFDCLNQNLCKKVP